ncbi:DNA-processing protein DprA [Marivita sp.]|uniref:DNA-processing protein DprA n=1 Tax=Marivita sp. TaxID=2003365 RepID=UPI003423BF01
MEQNSSTHPLLPPTTEDQRFAWLRLLRSRRVGISTFYRLMGDHGSAAAALQHLPEIARAAGVPNYELCPEAVIHAEFKAAKGAGAVLICRGDAAYPLALCDLDDAPPMLWAIGNTDILSQPQIALVGARNASSLGGRMARSLATALGEAGYVITSGLARGVDTAAHIAALKTGTIAVLGGGVDILYPAENAKLADDIVEQGGARISEQPMGLQPQARHFPARNRIISGLARAVIVVEAAAKSGSLITARTALDQGRDVMAVPGHPFDARASGCNMLLRDGARLVRNAEDVIEALAPLAPQSAPELPLEPARDDRPLAEIAKLHQKILDRLGPSPLGEDQLIRDLGATSRVVSPALTDLELEGRINRQPGGLISRTA